MLKLINRDMIFTDILSSRGLKNAAVVCMKPNNKTFFFFPVFAMTIKLSFYTAFLYINQSQTDIVEYVLVSVIGIDVLCIYI